MDFIFSNEVMASGKFSLIGYGMLWLVRHVSNHMLPHGLIGGHHVAAREATNFLLRPKCTPLEPKLGLIFA